MDELHQLAEKAAHQPIQFWGAFLVFGSVAAGYLSVRKMVNTLREENTKLMGMLREKDERLKELENKIFTLLEEQRRKRP